VGSGNIGATNVFRVLGWPAGVLVLGADALKGYLACAWACDGWLWLLERAGVPPGEVALHRVLAGVAAVLGHNYTCWLRFHGGKGIATSAGAYAALAPGALAIALGVWLVLFGLTRFVSVASLGAAVALPVAVWLTQADVTLGMVTTVLGALAIAKHRANLRRLLHGTEPRVQFKRPTPAP